MNQRLRLVINDGEGSDEDEVVEADEDEDYLAARHPKTGAFPSYALRIKEEGATRFEFA